MIAETIQNTANQIFESIRKEGVLRKIIHGDEGPNHWYDLYEVINKKTFCGKGCNKNAKFLLYEHYHTGEVETILSCEDHCPQSYLELLENHTAG